MWVVYGSSVLALYCGNMWAEISGKAILLANQGVIFYETGPVQRTKSLY